MRPEPFVARLAQSLVITLAISHWCVSVIGIARMDLAVVVTFAWAAATARRLMDAGPAGPLLMPGRRVEIVMSALGGQVLWILLPMLRRANPDGWMWEPVPIEAEAAVAGAVVLVGYILYPFFRRLALAQGLEIGPSAPELDAPLLCFGFFLVSGSLVFAGIAFATIAALSFQVFGARHSALPTSRDPLRETGGLAPLSY